MNSSVAFFLLGWAVAMTLALMLIATTRRSDPPPPVVFETRSEPANGGCGYPALFVAGAFALFIVWLFLS